MKSLLCPAIICMVGLVMNGNAQDSKKEAQKGGITRAMYWVPNQHCPDCAMALEWSLRKIGGIKSVTVNFPTRWATVEFDESHISAQEVSRAMFQAPHAMGKDIKYRGFLLLSVLAKDKAAITKATTTLEKMDGVAKAVYFPQTKFVAIQFADKGKVTSTQLINALESAGIKASQASAQPKK